MFGRQDLYDRPCATCSGSGKSPKKRTRACESCKGSGKESGCRFCGGTYGKDCVDILLDQSVCSKRPTGKDRVPLELSTGARPEPGKFIPHGYMDRVGAKGERTDWRCRYCKQSGSLTHMMNSSCPAAYAVCGTCGQYPCKTDCEAVLQALSRDDVHIAGSPIERGSERAD